MTIYSKELKEITDFTHDFFVFAEQNNYDESLTNGRRLAEAICKLLIFNNHSGKSVEYVTKSGAEVIRLDARDYSFLIKENTKGATFKDFSYKFYVLILEIKGFIHDKRFFKAVEILKEQGNPTAHSSGGRKIFTEEDFEICEPQVTFLVQWLFQHLNLSLPLEIKEIFENAYKVLKVFKPLPSVLKVDRAGKLFENQLVYFPEQERQQINTICDNLHQNQHLVFLQGQPAKGKTVTTFEIARQMENAGWKVYYYSFKNTKESCLSDIKENLYRKYLFVIDDCHLDVDTMSDIYYQIHDLNYTIALLFVSRILTQDFQSSEKYDFNVFEILEEVTFKQSESTETKIAGITQCYQTFYQQLQTEEYIIDNIHYLAEEVKGNLVALSLYLDQWKQIYSLAKVDRKEVLKGIHFRYIRPLDERSKTCLLKYACLFYFEIKFETLPHYESETDALAKLGIIENQSENIYGFYHSEFAHLLLEAFISQDHIFTRKYKNLDNFIAAHLKDYLLAFKQENYYPFIIPNLFVNLANSNPALLQPLFLDADLQSLFLDYYQEEKSELNIRIFSSQLSRYFPNLFMSIFSNLLKQNPLFRYVTFETEQSLGLYCQVLINLKNNPLNYQQFLEQYGNKKSPVFKLAKLSIFAPSLVTWKKYIDNTEAQEILDSFNHQILIEKIQQVDFIGIGHALNELNIINSQKAAALFNSIDNQILIEKIQQTSFTNIGNALNELNQVNSQKAAALFNSIDNQILIEKIQHHNFYDIGEGLNRLNKVNPQKAAALFNSIDNQLLIEKIQQHNFSDIGEGLNRLNKVNPQKAAALFNSIDNQLLIEKIQQHNFSDIGEGLNRLNKVNPQKAAALFNSIDNQLLIEKIQQHNFSDIGEGLNRLNKVNPQKAAALFNSIDNQLLIEKIQQVDFIGIGKALNELNKVNPQKAAALFNSIDNQLLIEKIQQHNFSDIGEGLNRLNKVNPQKAAALFNSIDNQLLIEKIQQVDFIGIGKALNELNQVNPQKAIEIFELINTKLLADKARQGRLGFLQIANPFSQLHQVNAEKTQAIFKLMQNVLPISEWLKEIPKLHSQQFIRVFGIFSLLDIKLAKTIIEQVPESYLLQKGALQDTRNYNKLLYWLWLMEFDAKYPLIQKLVKFGQTNLNSFLSDKSTRSVGSFLRMLNEYIPVKPILERERGRLIGKMLFEEDKTTIPKYIAIIHEIDEQIGLDFLKTFQKKQPELIEQVAFSYLYIGENYQQQHNISKAEQFFNKAEPLLKQLNHPDGLTLLASLREKNLNQIKPPH